MDCIIRKTRTCVTRATTNFVTQMLVNVSARRTSSLWTQFVHPMDDRETCVGKGQLGATEDVTVFMATPG